MLLKQVKYNMKITVEVAGFVYRGWFVDSVYVPR